MARRSHSLTLTRASSFFLCFLAQSAPLKPIGGLSALTIGSRGLSTSTTGSRITLVGKHTFSGAHLSVAPESSMGLQTVVDVSECTNHSVTLIRTWFGIANAYSRELALAVDTPRMAFGEAHLNHKHPSIQIPLVPASPTWAW